MIRLSSNLTLFCKIFIPTFWIVFFGSMTIAIIISEGRSILPVDHTTEIIIVLCFFFIFLLFLYFTVMRLQRVEIDQDFLYVTNYFKSFRYPLSDIKELRKIDLILVKILRIEFKDKTHFGKTINCLLKPQGLKDYMENFPGKLPFR